VRLLRRKDQKSTVKTGPTARIKALLSIDGAATIVEARNTSCDRVFSTE
jgi:hypothetical protein